MSATAHPAPAFVRRPYRALRFSRDEELVRLLRAGDERAFETLYDRHHRGILAFCRHMLGSAEEAEDSVQHTFIAAHRDLVGSDKDIQLKAWLYTIARNRCLSLLRARKEERALEEVPEPSVHGLTAEVQQREDLRDLLADLQRLPEDQRAALVLSELGALSHEEIGATLGVRKDKVKALVFQARESLASSRSARHADCREIQEQLSVLRGGSLRRTTLRRHVEVCPACSAFKAEVKRQRGAMAAILPVVPSLALKESVLAAVFGGGAAGGGGIIGGGLLAGGSKALAAKVATIGVVAGGAAGGGLVAIDELSGGGDGNTATAMAGAPGEQRSARMVDGLRGRAHEIAGRPTAGRGATPASSTGGGSEVVAGDRPRRNRARGRAVRTAGIRGETVAADALALIVAGAKGGHRRSRADDARTEKAKAERTNEQRAKEGDRREETGGRQRGGDRTATSPGELTEQAEALTAPAPVIGTRTEGLRSRPRTEAATPPAPAPEQEPRHPGDQGGDVPADGEPASVTATDLADAVDDTLPLR